MATWSVMGDAGGWAEGKERKTCRERVGGFREEKIHGDSGRNGEKEAPRSAEEDSKAREAGNTDDALGEPSRRRPGDPPSEQRRAQWPAEDVVRLI